MKRFTRKQTELIALLKKHYPQGISTDDPEVRQVSDSLIERGNESGLHLVELIDNDETPTGDCYRLTDAYAEAFRTDAEERAREAESN
jgi:hypothetical protein